MASYPSRDMGNTKVHLVYRGGLGRKNKGVGCFTNHDGLGMELPLDDPETMESIRGFF